MEDSGAVGPDVSHIANNTAPQQDTVMSPQARDNHKPLKRLKGKV